MTMETSTTSSRLNVRRDAVGDILHNVDDAAYARLHDIHTENSQSEDDTGIRRPSSAVTDRTVLRSPRFHQRRNALECGEKVDRAFCSRLKQLNAIHQADRTMLNMNMINQSNSSNLPGTVC